MRSATSLPWETGEDELPRISSRRLRRCRFDDLGKVEKKGAHLRLWDECNALLAEVTLSDHKMMRSLVAGLRDAGKLD